MVISCILSTFPYVSHLFDALTVLTCQQNSLFIYIFHRHSYCVWGLKSIFMTFIEREMFA
jgi:hypothetical protein